MSANIRNAESAFMAGKARFEAWREKFEQEWGAPIFEDQLRSKMDKIPPDMLQSVRSNLSESARQTLDQLITRKE